MWIRIYTRVLGVNWLSRRDKYGCGYMCLCMHIIFMLILHLTLRFSPCYVLCAQLAHVCCFVKTNKKVNYKKKKPSMHLPALRKERGSTGKKLNAKSPVSRRLNTWMDNINIQLCLFPISISRWCHTNGSTNTRLNNKAIFIEELSHISRISSQWVSSKKTNLKSFIKSSNNMLLNCYRHDPNLFKATDNDISEGLWVYQIQPCN